MQLPETKKERVQIFALMGIGVLFVLYVAGNYAIKPIMNKRTERTNRIAALRSDIEMGEQIVKLVKLGKAANDEEISQIVAISETAGYVLKPRLGNYLLGVTEIVEACARRAHMPIASLVEVGIADIPARKHDPNAFMLYTVRIQAECGLHPLVRLLRFLEEGNPYLAISKLIITGQPSQPGLHSVTFDMQWPIWRDETMLAEIVSSAKQFEEHIP